MKISEIRKRLKKNQLLFFTYKKLTDKDYLSNYRDYLKSNNTKTADVVEKEMALIRDFWKCDPMHYYRYRLYEKKLSYDELIDYIPAYYFYNYHMHSLYGSHVIPVTESKTGLNEYFAEKKIETAVPVAILRKGKLYKPDGMTEMSFSEFIRAMLKSESEKFFVKPDKGRGGKGIFMITKIWGRFYIGNITLTEKSFEDKILHGDYIIQESLIQRSDISSINPSSVNTLRVITQCVGDKYKISAVVIRIGRNNSIVDNSTQGGISVNIDTETGKFSRYAYTEHTKERFEKHPDTGFVFEGFGLRGWDKIKNDILDYASRATEFPELGWDIAILEDRIAVIELNINYGIDHLQCCIGGMRRKLNINPLYIKH
jgi:hypothetical protein